MKKIIFLLLLVLSSQVGCTLTDPEVMEMLKALQAQNDKLLEEITQMKGQVSDLDGKYQVILAGLADNKKDLEALKAQVEALKTQIADQLKKIDQRTAQLTQQGADIVKLNAELAEVKASLADLLVEFGELIRRQNCDSIVSLPDKYQAGSVFGATGPTIINDVTNPKTGKTWMDRNLGASRAATSSTDAASYGDLYQWGRGADGHQLRNSATTTILSGSNKPGNGNFILVPTLPGDWRNPKNDNLWQGINGINNPCPCGYRLPTKNEWIEEIKSWSVSNVVGAFNSPLRLPLPGNRSGAIGSLNTVGVVANYASSTVNGDNSFVLVITESFSEMYPDPRAYGWSVRCIKD